MITFARMGKFGRLGNQIFQYATMVAVARKKNIKYVLPNSCIVATYDAYFNDVTKKNELGKFELFDAFKIKCPLIDDDILRRNIQANFSESSFLYDSNVWNIPNNTNLHGYYQSEKYFLEIREELLQQLSFKDEIQKAALKFLSAIDSDVKVSIHVRRGDNVAHPEVHPLSDLNYISICMNELKKEFSNIKFVILTDDLEWCREHFEGDEFIFSENNHFTDMAIMSLCDHNIIANSSLVGS